MTPEPPKPSTGTRVAVSAAKSGCLLGLIGFAGGFFGPMIFAPQSNQGPMLGIFLHRAGGNGAGPVHRRGRGLEPPE
ncbi:MAG: hypothetical protein JNM65_08150 [Verrucomicrobiaceae bacterium]|nr:hypothetical protein [Verrucomicrobiaceae bacterium]